MTTKTAPHARRISIFIIIVSIVAVIFTLFCEIFYDPERIAKSEVESLASWYYENYFYENFANSRQFINSKNIDEAMNKYVKSGFAKVSLRQLLLRHQADTTNSKKIALSYCDENNTFVVFYPESPYSQNSYHTEYTYSCEF